MEFCNFVPAGARSYILEMINGEPPKWDGLQRLVDKAKEQLDQVLQKNQNKVGLGSLLSTAEVKEQCRAEAHYQQLLGDLEAVKRLGTHSLMEPAYKALHKKFRADEPLRRFLFAAWSARINFLPHRDALTRAMILSKQIAVDAEHLAAKIRELFETFHDTPLELQSISELLRQTDNNQLDGHNRWMWRIHRGVILGDPPLDQKDTFPKKQGLFMEPTPPTDTDIYRANLRYTWTLAPDFAELLLKIAETMGDFVPQKTGYIGAGIGSREVNEKTAYIRGFHKLLKDEHGFDICLQMKKAIAAVTAVMLNNPDIEVTADDVTKAIRYYKKR